MTGLGIFCIVYRDFIIGRPPAWSSFNPSMLGWITGTIVILIGLAIALGRKGALAALVLAIMILLLSVSRHCTQFMTDWPNAYKTLALAGGALVVASAFLLNDNRVIGNFRIKKKTIDALLFIGTALMAAFFIAAGYAHFKWAEFVPTLIPSFIPFPVFWTYFCGILLIAGGIGILVPPTRKLAALLSGIMVLGWFLLLHIPRVIADPGNMSDRLGLFESFTFVGVFFVMAGLFARKK
jgi:uncharacterized membrane protein YphA (DoxX/SURF4 family)